MPEIIVTASEPGERGLVEIHRERIGPENVETDTSTQQLIERIGWALSDATEVEQEQPRAA